MINLLMFWLLCRSFSRFLDHQRKAKLEGRVIFMRHSCPRGVGAQLGSVSIFIHKHGANLLYLSRLSLVKSTAIKGILWNLPSFLRFRGCRLGKRRPQKVATNIGSPITSFLALTLLRQVSIFLLSMLAHCSLAACCLLSCTALALVVMANGDKSTPLMAIARWNSPSLNGDSTCKPTLETATL